MVIVDENGGEAPGPSKGREGELAPPPPAPPPAPAPPLPQLRPSLSALRFSPMKTDTYDGRTALFSVAVHGLDGADGVALCVEEAPGWLSLSEEGTGVEAGVHTFHFRAHYDGAEFAEGPAKLRLRLQQATPTGCVPDSTCLATPTGCAPASTQLATPTGCAPDSTQLATPTDCAPDSTCLATPTGCVPDSTCLRLQQATPTGCVPDSTCLRLVVESGQRARPISVHPGNLEAFNAYANTEAGLSLHYRLRAEVVLPPPPPGHSNWTPIGTKHMPFAGGFDGAGHSMGGLTLEAVGRHYQGLFGALGKGAVVENLGLPGARVHGADFVGALAGFSHGTLRNSHAEGEVHGARGVGGLVGWNERGTLHTCHAAGHIGGSHYVGGLVGENNGGRVKNSYATGEVRGSHGGVGGLVGENRGAVKHAHAAGTVHGDWEVGGLVGNNSGAIHNSHACGAVRGESTLGGLVGVNSGTLERSYATGAVSGQGDVGGLAGENAAVVANSYATGETGGQWHVGGLVGWNGAEGSITNTYASGSVCGGTSAGGLVGGNYGSVRSSVALSPRVWATAKEGVCIARIGGEAEDVDEGALAHNHARSTLDIRYGINPDGSGGTPKTIDNNAHSTDGQSVSVGKARVQYNHITFWHGLGWDFKRIWEWGPQWLPMLKKVAKPQGRTDTT